MNKEFILCVPVIFDQNLPDRAQYSQYTKISCLDCRIQMWLGERSRARAESNPEATVCCMVCAVTKYRLEDQMERVVKLTDRDQ